MGWKYFVVLSGVLLLTSVSGLCQTWTKYECDTTPDLATPAWSHEENDGSVSSDGDVLTIVGPDDGKEVWVQSSTAFNSTTGWTVEFRLRVNNQLSDWDEELEFIRVRDGVHSLRLFLGQSDIGPDGFQTKDYTTDGNTFDSGNLYDVKGWHTYRLTGQAGNLNMYRDGDPTPIMTVTMDDPSTNNEIKFGDIQTSAQAALEVDYIWWANDGAYPPTAPVAAEDPVLVNGDMDNIYDADTPFGVGNGDVLGWEQWQLDGNPSTFQYTYEASPWWRHTLFARCLRIFDPNFGFDGGLRQVVDITPGSRCTLSGWVNLYHPDTVNIGHTAQVGIDPSGGTDLNDVVWSAPVPVGYDEGTSGWDYHEASVSTVSPTSQITAYVRVTFSAGSGQERSFFADDFTLTLAPAVTGVSDAFWYLYP
jgi:hypothetical protein